MEKLYAGSHQWDLAEGRLWLKTREGADGFERGEVMMSRLYVGVLCSIVSILLIGCVKPPNEWLGIPFVPEAYRIRGGGGGYSYTAPVPVEEAAAWYRERLGEAGWSVPGENPNLRVRNFDICARRGEEKMTIRFYGGRIDKRTRITIQNAESTR